MLLLITACGGVTQHGASYKIATALTLSAAIHVARAEGVSFSKVWRLAERECIELTAGRAAKGYKRLSPERRAKVIEVRRANPNATL